jgi:hypothetical protein
MSLFKHWRSKCKSVDSLGDKVYFSQSFFLAFWRWPDDLLGYRGGFSTPQTGHGSGSSHPLAKNGVVRLSHFGPNFIPSFIILLFYYFYFLLFFYFLFLNLMSKTTSFWAWVGVVDLEFKTV